MTALLSWATSAYSIDSPLPPLSARLRVRGTADRGAWPVGLLPHKAIAADAVVRGAAYRDGVGYLIGDARVDAVTVGRLAADVLDDAADRLDLNFAKSVLGLVRLGARSTSEAVRLHEETVDALHATARDVRASSRAASALARLLRPFFPAPVPAPVDDNVDPVALESFLARFDGSALLPRADLWRLYEGHARPGGLTKGALFTAATDRWGDLRKVRGVMAYRPASRAVGPSGAPSAPVRAHGPVTAPHIPRRLHARRDRHGRRARHPVPDYREAHAMTADHLTQVTDDSPVSLMIERLLAGESLPRRFRDADHTLRASVVRFSLARGRYPSDDWPRLCRTAERFAEALA